MTSCLPGDVAEVVRRGVRVVDDPNHSPSLQAIVRDLNRMMMEENFVRRTNLGKRVISTLETFEAVTGQSELEPMLDVRDDVNLEHFRLYMDLAYPTASSDTRLRKHKQLSEIVRKRYRTSSSAGSVASPSHGASGGVRLSQDERMSLLKLTQQLARLQRNVVGMPDLDSSYTSEERQTLKKYESLPASLFPRRAAQPGSEERRHPSAPRASKERGTGAFRPSSLVVQTSLEEAGEEEEDDHSAELTQAATPGVAPKATAPLASGGRAPLLPPVAGLPEALEAYRRSTASTVPLDPASRTPSRSSLSSTDTAEADMDPLVPPSRLSPRLSDQTASLGRPGRRHVAVSPRFRFKSALEMKIHSACESFEKASARADWDIDILGLDQKTGGHSLLVVATVLFNQYQLLQNFKVPAETFEAFILKVEEGYCFDPAVRNPYHNASHAADVLATVSHMVLAGPLSERLNAFHAFSLFVAAIVHDYRHPGVNQNFLVNSRSEISLKYNDKSILENFHISEAFRLFWQGSKPGVEEGGQPLPSTDITQYFSVEEQRRFRAYVIDMVLATDLAKGMDYLSRFKNQLLRVADAGASSNSLTSGGAPSQEVVVSLLMQMTLKCADVSHPAKPWGTHIQWTELISQEFFLQGDQEKQQGLPVSMLCDRDKEDRPKSQIGFINFVVKPCFEVLVQFCRDHTPEDTPEVSSRSDNPVSPSSPRTSTSIESAETARGSRLSRNEGGDGNETVRLRSEFCNRRTDPDLWLSLLNANCEEWRAMQAKAKSEAAPPTQQKCAAVTPKGPHPLVAFPPATVGAVDV